MWASFAFSVTYVIFNAVWFLTAPEEDKVIYGVMDWGESVPNSLLTSAIIIFVLVPAAGLIHYCVFRCVVGDESWGAGKRTAQANAKFSFHSSSARSFGLVLGGKALLEEVGANCRVDFGAWVMVVLRRSICEACVLALGVGLALPQWIHWIFKDESVYRSLGCRTSHMRFVWFPYTGRRVQLGALGPNKELALMHVPLTFDLHIAGPDPTYDTNAGEASWFWRNPRVSRSSRSPPPCTDQTSRVHLRDVLWGRRAFSCP